MSTSAPARHVGLAGDHVFYAYWAHASGMRMTKFKHIEHGGAQGDNCRGRQTHPPQTLLARA